VGDFCMPVLWFCVVAEYGLVRKHARGESLDVVPSINGCLVWGINDWIASCATSARSVHVLPIMRLIVYCDKQGCPSTSL